VSIVAVVLVATTGAVAVFGVRTRGRLANGLGVVAWIAVLGAAILVRPGDAILIGDGTLVATPFGRLVAMVAAGSGLLLCLAIVAAAVTPVVHAAGLAGLAALTVAVTSTDPAMAAWAITGGSAAALVVGLVAGRGGAGAVELGAGLRATVAAGAAAVVAVALGAASAEAQGDRVVGSLAFLAAAGGLAIRAAAIPFHRWAARIADVAPRPILAMLIGWLPAVAVVVTLAWSDATLAPIVEDLGWSRAALVAVALLTMGLGGLAAWLADDLAHTVAYTAIAGAGVTLLGVSAIDPAAWAATRTAALCGAVTTTGLVAWVVALEGAYRTRRLPDLTGWGRRSPVLAVALVGLAWVTVGTPILSILEARTTIVEAAIEGPFVWPALALTVVPVIGLVRAILVGTRRPDPAILAGRGDRPRLPPRPDHGDLPLSGTARVGEETAIAWASVSRNAALVGSTAVLATAILAVALASGGLGLANTAAGPPPGVATPFDPGAGPAPSDGVLEPSD
jgi:NADH-quinone oxidoreductase subunit N